MTKSRGYIDLRIGTRVMVGGLECTISELVDFRTLLVNVRQTGRSQIVSIHEVKALEFEDHQKQDDIICVPDTEWVEAERRYLIIKPFLDKEKTREEVAKQAGVDPATIYRWVKRYQAYGTLDGLRPMKPGLAVGQKTLNRDAELMIQRAINELYLTDQRVSVYKVVIEVERLCKLYRIQNVPHSNTIRNRITEISLREQLNKRGFKEKARNKHDPASGHFPNADYPLDVVQIDHTEVDLILVDDVYRLPIGRPVITLAIDVNTRMVVGYYLSLDAPSVTSVALCVSHAVLPKDSWLAMHGIDEEWPVWGVMNKIHVDNAAEFRSVTFQKACLANNICLEYRPVKKPRYGAHIERLMGTFAQEIHEIPGTTHSSVSDNKEYDSEGKAIYTLSEFEVVVLELICKYYHKRKHSALEMSPLTAWERGIFGDDKLKIVGSGLPRIPVSERNFFLDFLPEFMRPIHPTGVTIDNRQYYADVLRSFIGMADPDNPKEKRKFLFRRDPRDISKIWFYDTEVKDYFEIPFADLSLPSMSIWEHRALKQFKKDNEGIFLLPHEEGQVHADIRERHKEAAKNTKKARRLMQRSIEHQKKIDPVSVRSSAVKANIRPDISESFGLNSLSDLKFEDNIS